MRGARRVAAATVVGTVVAVLSTAPSGAQPPAGSEVVGFVVTRESGTSAREAAALVEQEVGDVDGRAAVAPGVTAVGVSDLTPQQAAAAASALEEVDGIARVDVDTRATPNAAPNDPLFSKQWSLTDPVSGVAAVPAWDLATGSGQVIAVIDTGITAHEDLAGNLLPGYDMITDPVVAHDGNGRDADATDEGDWLTAGEISADPASFSGCPTQARSTWHGTHVAGLASAVRNNGKGIVGVAPDATILPVRALGKCGGTMSDIAAAITWASGGEVPGLPVNPTPADVINLSLSSTALCQPFVQAAIDGAMDRGSTVVASAGNTARPFDQASPGGCYDIITVGAVTRTGARAPYSNYGVAGRDLPLFAPGGAAETDAAGLVSTVNAGATTAGADTYAAYNGTSMAAPLVAGAAALLHERTGMSPLAIAEHLRDTARAFPAGSNCTGSCGAGLLDVQKALTVAPRVPGEPGALVARPADGSIHLSWQAPVDPGTGPVTGYALEYRIGGGAWTPVDNIWTSTLPQKVLSGLTNGVPHQARVAARNVFGRGPWVQSVEVTPRGLPGSVQISSVRYPSKRSVRLGLRLPADALEGMQYRVTEVGAEPSGWTDVPAAASLRVAGLAKGVRHEIEVRVLNEIGAGPSATRQIATPVRPGKVRKLAVTRTGLRAKVSWLPPRRTGMDIRYRVRAGDGRWRATSGTSVRVPSVPPGRVRFEVKARNEAGFGPVQFIVKRK